MALQEKRKGVGDLVLFVVVLAVSVLLVGYLKEKIEQQAINANDYLGAAGATEDDRIAVASTEALRYAINCEAMQKINNEVCAEKSFPPAKTKSGFQAVVHCDSDRCTVSDFSLPQKGDEATLRSAMAGYGDPKYVLYYGQVADEEAEAWIYHGNDFTVIGLVAAGAQNAMLGGFFMGAGKVIAKAEGKVLRAVMEKGWVSTESRIGLRARRIIATQEGIKAIDNAALSSVAKEKFGKDLAELSPLQRGQAKLGFHKKFLTDKKFRKEMKLQYKTLDIAAEEQKVLASLAKKRIFSETTEDVAKNAELRHAIKEHRPTRTMLQEEAYNGLPSWDDIPEEARVGSGFSDAERRKAASIVAKAELDGELSSATLAKLRSDVPSVGNALAIEDVLIAKQSVRSAIAAIPKAEKEKIIQVSRASESLDPVMHIPDLDLAAQYATRTSQGAYSVVRDMFSNPLAFDKKIVDQVNAVGVDLTEAEAKTLRHQIIVVASDHINLVDTGLTGAQKLANVEKVFKEANELSSFNVVDIIDQAVDNADIAASKKFAYKAALADEVVKKMEGQAVKNYVQKMTDKFMTRYSALDESGKRTLFPDYSFTDTMKHSISFRFFVFDAMESIDVIPNNVTVDGREVDTRTFFQCSSLAFRMPTGLASTPLLSKIASKPGSFTEQSFQIGASADTCVLMAMAYSQMRLDDCHQQKFRPIGVNSLGLSKAVEPFTVKSEISQDETDIDTDSCSDSLLGFPLKEEVNQFYVQLIRQSFSTANARFYLASPCKATITVESRPQKCQVALCAGGDPMAIELYGNPSKDFPAYAQDGTTRIFYKGDTGLALEREAVCGRFEPLAISQDEARSKLKDVRALNPFSYLSIDGMTALAGLAGVDATPTTETFDGLRRWMHSFLPGYRGAMAAINHGIDEGQKKCNEGGSIFNPFSWPGWVIDVTGKALQWTSIPGVTQVGEFASWAGGGWKTVANFPVGVVCNMGGAIIKVTVNGVTDVLVGTSVIGPMKLEAMIHDPYIGSVYTAHKMYQMTSTPLETTCYVESGCGADGCAKGFRRVTRAGACVACTQTACTVDRTKVIEADVMSGDYKLELNPIEQGVYPPLNPKNEDGSVVKGVKYCDDSAFTGDIGSFAKTGYQTFTDNPANMLGEYSNPQNDVNAIWVTVSLQNTGDTNFCFTNPKNAFWYKAGITTSLIIIDFAGDILTGGAWSVTGGFFTGMAYVWFEDNIKEGSGWPKPDVKFKDVVLGQGFLRDVFG